MRMRPETKAVYDLLTFLGKVRDRVVETLTEAVMNLCIKTGRVLHITGTGGPDDIYLIRYYVIRSKYLNVFIHQFLRSDRDDLHDHPWHFCTYLVRGSYYEKKFNPKTGDVETTRRHSGDNARVYRKNETDRLFCSQFKYEFKQKRFVVRKATDQHQVLTDHHFKYDEREFAPLTICVTGPTIREWGFIKTFYQKIPLDPAEKETIVLTLPGVAMPELNRPYDVAVYRGPIRQWVNWREYLGLPPDEPGRG